MAAAAAYYKKAAIVDFPCVVEGMRHMFSLIPLGSDIFDTEFLRIPKKVPQSIFLGGNQFRTHWPWFMVVKAIVNFRHIL